MNAGRWYPTTTTLPNGDVLVLSGDIDTTTGRQPAAGLGDGNRAMAGFVERAALDRIVSVHALAPNGQLIMTGADATTRYLDPSGTGSLRVVADSNFGFRDYGTSVLYDDGKILLSVAVIRRRPRQKSSI